MYAILMDENKQLICTHKEMLYQRENLVDKICFIFPKEYDGINLFEENYFIALKYMDMGNVPHLEILDKGKELYKEKYIKCTLPVTSELSRFSGDVKIRISFVKADTVNTYVMHSGEHILHIEPVAEYFQYNTDEAIELVDKALANRIKSGATSNCNCKPCCDDVLDLYDPDEEQGCGCKPDEDKDDCGCKDNVIDLEDEPLPPAPPVDPDDPDDDEDDDDGIVIF